jgi:hypothetical protein
MDGGLRFMRPATTLRSGHTAAIMICLAVTGAESIDT